MRIVCMYVGDLSPANDADVFSQTQNSCECNRACGMSKRDTPYFRRLAFCSFGGLAERTPAGFGLHRKENSLLQRLQKQMTAVAKADGVAILERFGGELGESHLFDGAQSELAAHRF